jgi:hypothetical protein
MTILAKIGIAMLLYLAIFAAFYCMCETAPFDPHDSNTRDTDK